MNQKKLGLIIGLACGVFGLGAGIFAVVIALAPQRAREPFTARLDPAGPYLLLSTEAASRQYAEALAEARKLHPGAAELVFQTGALKPVEEAFRKQQPRYAMVFILPDELDVNFAWQWLRLAALADDDPFVDVRTGFITGDSPAAAARFVRRIRDAVEKQTPLPGMVIDNLGPNAMAAKAAFNQMRGVPWMPALGERMKASTLSHGTEGFTQERLGSMDGAGMLHFGGHGYPDRIVEGATSALARQMKLSPCVVFNGACYTGVTGRWFDMQATVKEQRVAPDQSFCLALLANNVIGYLAAMHPDHGIPVYQEMEYLATDGVSLGDAIKHTYDGIILGAGGKLPELKPFSNGAPTPQWSPTDFMLKGTASRVLFGDPALILTPAFTAQPFAITVNNEDANALRVTAVMKNSSLKSTFTDTYHADLASDKKLFNDRALITVRLPDGWDAVKKVEILKATAGGKPIKSRLVGFGVEKEGSARILHAQVDVPTSGHMQSEFRSGKGAVEIRIQR